MIAARRDQQQASSTPTRPPPKPPGLASVLARNIEALRKRQAEEEALATFEERLAGRITRFTGSMRFVYLHLAIFGLWIVGNLGLVPGFPQFDPSFVILAMVASVEAIFLSTFVLISQNRMAAAADKRDDLDLQINLLSEHEITRLIKLVDAIAERMGVGDAADPEMEELERDVTPEALMEEMERLAEVTHPHRHR